MSERGVFAVSRGIWTDPDFAKEPFTEREAFMWLVSEAAWKPYGKRADGKVVQLGRGQLCHSVRFMAEAWSWSSSRVDRFLGRVEKRDMIRRDHGTRTPVLTVCKYDEYQRVSLPERDNSGTTCGTRAGQERDKLEDIKNIKQDLLSEAGASDPDEPKAIKQPKAQPQLLFGPPEPKVPAAHNDPKPKPKRGGYSAEFEAFWLGYPTDANMSKKRAGEVWGRLSPEQRLLAMAGLPGFVAYCRKNPRYRPVHAEKWLRDARFEGFAKQTAAAAPDGAGGLTAEQKANAERSLVRKWLDNPFSWPARMGPKPGEPGCSVPAKILAEFGIGPLASRQLGDEALAKVKGEAA